MYDNRVHPVFQLLTIKCVNSECGRATTSYKFAYLIYSETTESLMSSVQTLTTWRYSPSDDNFALKSTTRSVGSREVLIKTTHSGLCYTDVHAKSKGCGLGHEGVGHIVRIGSEVTAHKVGDRVGWG